MGVLPVPDEIREMSAGIAKLVSVAESQNKWLEKIHAELTQMRSGNSGELKAIARKLESAHSTMTASKDSLRMVCNLLESRR